MRDFLAQMWAPILWCIIMVVCGSIIAISLTADKPSPYMQQQIPKMGYKTYTRVETADGCVWRIWLREGTGRTRSEIELRPDGTENCKGR